ncbi:mitochondrial small ribosomal subunit Rsm22-domain-containing protein [Globomyces pollinis-pini]|nr:mitochondrial small ribosomal subunit Rsm22-domain-containing protein [Globomyces pollinis-pini]
MFTRLHWTGGGIRNSKSRLKSIAKLYTTESDSTALFDDMKSMATSRIGLVSIPKPLEHEMKIWMQPFHRLTIKECTQRIQTSLMSTGSPLLKSIAERTAIENNLPVPNLQPHSLSYDKYESAAYVASRMIPTYGAIYNVLSQINKRIPNFKPESVTDFGTGPGTALWAIQQFWNSSIKQMTAIDVSESMLNIVESFSKNPELSIKDLKLKRYLPIQSKYNTEEQSDLVISAFTLSELPNDTNRTFTVETLWKQTKDTLILIDRGTPIGFQIIANARQQLIDLAKKENQELHVVAPCAHELKCPVLTSRHGHWCHFSQSITLNTVMRNAKSTRNCNEDSKFSFIVLRKTKRPTIEPSTASNSILQLQERSYHWPRLILPPLKRPKHAVLDICSPEGLWQRTTISKSHPNPLYSHARKSFWGDLWPHEISSKLITREDDENDVDFDEKPKLKRTKAQKHLQYAMKMNPDKFRPRKNK